jgi:outer membrane lipopolysaccharide assembly protein LptE/RlpB
MKAKGNRREATGNGQQATDRISSFNYCLLPIAYCLLLLAGCGYQFSGRGEAFPKDVKTVFVETLVNRSRDPGIESELTSALRSELRQRGQLRVVDSLEQADAVLSGVVRSFDIRVVAVNREDEVLQFEIVLIADMNLRRRSPEELLWRTQGARLAELHSGSRGAVVTSSSSFKSGTLNPGDVRRLTDIQLTETLRQEAKERLVEKFAREMHQRLMELF